MKNVIGCSPLLGHHTKNIKGPLIYQVQKQHKNKINNNKKQTNKQKQQKENKNKNNKINNQKHKRKIKKKELKTKKQKRKLQIEKKKIEIIRDTSHIFVQISTVYFTFVENNVK